MFARVMAHVAGLTQSGQVAGAVVAGIVIEMRAGEDHAGPAKGQGRGDARQARLLADHVGRGAKGPHAPAPPVPPAPGAVVPRGSVAEMDDLASVGPPAMLAASLSAAEADQRRQFAPVDRIKPAMVACDRHGPL